MTEPAPGALLAVPLDGGRTALAQVIAVEAGSVAISLADRLWDCTPGPLDWQDSGRALLHLAVRPAALAGSSRVGDAAVSDEARAAHGRWRAAPSVTAAPLAVVVGALLTD